MNVPIYNVRKPPSEFCANREECLFNDYLPTNYDEVKLMKEKYSSSFFNQKDIDQSKYLIKSNYQTLKEDNHKKDLHTQPYVSYMKNTSKNIENKYINRQGTNASLKPQSSFNGRLLNNNISYYNNLKSGSKEIKKVKSHFITEANIFSNEPNMGNTKDNSNSNLINYNFYQRIYSKKQSPNKSPITFLVKPVLYEDSNLNLNNMRDHPRIDTSKKVFASENKVNDKRMKSGEKKFYAKKKDNVTRKRNNNLKIEITENRRYIENRLIEEKYKNINKSDNFQTYDDHFISMNYFNNSEIRDIDFFFQNNFFHEIGNKNSKNKHILIERQDNYENIHSKKGINVIFKSKKKEREKKKTDILSKKSIKLCSNNIQYKIPSLYLIYQKGFNILFKIIKNRLNIFWKSLKYIIWRQKSYSYYHFSKAGKTITYNPQKITSSINTESPICNTLDNEQNKSKENISSNKKVVECNTSRNKRKYQTNYQKMKFTKILKENDQLHNINTMANNDNEKLLKKMKNMKGQNAQIMQSESRKNILFLENKKLKLKLKRLHTKYFVKKKIYANTQLLNKALYTLNKNSILISEKKRKITLLHNLVKFKENCIKQILKKYFYKFYMNTRILFYKTNFPKKEEQNYSIKEKLIKIIYRKEKDILLIIKKYLDIFYYNTMIQRPNKINFSITKNNNLFINNNYNLNIDKSFGDIIEKRKRKLKLIIKRIINKNKIILRSIIKQWILRTKLINMKMMFVKEENTKNKLNTLDAIIKNKIDNSASIKTKNNNLIQNNLIKGIEKLNYIFKSKSNNDNNNNNIIETIIKKEKVSNNNLFGKEKLINKIYGEHLKYKNHDDWIIEEKEEEQTEENGESTSIKNASEQIDDNLNIASDSNDIKSNEYINEREKIYFHKNI